MPFVDQDVMAKVRSIQWLKPDDGQFVPPAQAASNPTKKDVVNAP
jgi:hypothetical protein